jgi:hypothetical protein
MSSSSSFPLATPAFPSLFSVVGGKLYVNTKDGLFALTSNNNKNGELWYSAVVKLLQSATLLKKRIETCNGLAQNQNINISSIQGLLSQFALGLSAFNKLMNAVVGLVSVGMLRQLDETAFGFEIGEASPQLGEFLQKAAHYRLGCEEIVLRMEWSIRLSKVLQVMTKVHRESEACYQQLKPALQPKYRASFRDVGYQIETLNRRLQIYTNLFPPSGRIKKNVLTITLAGVVLDEGMEEQDVHDIQSRCVSLVQSFQMLQECVTAEQKK